MEVDVKAEEILTGELVTEFDPGTASDRAFRESAALPPGGLLVIHDAHLNAAKTGPLPVAAYSAILMSVTEGKCYATSELETLLTDAGFRDFAFAETIADRSVMTALKP